MPSQAERFGFTLDAAGVHDSRTIMLAELRALLAATGADAAHDAYRAAVVDDNVLPKRTMATRGYSFRRLRELYALDPDVLLFRALRELWDGDPSQQPLLAGLCAVARDPVMRATAPAILALPAGAEATPDDLTRAVTEAFPGRYNPRIAAKVGRNLASSWQQTGHLCGRRRKIRAAAQGGMAATIYALLLGYLCGSRGDLLLSTLWVRLLDLPESAVRAHALLASRRGWLDYRSAGGVTDVAFHHLLRNVKGSG